MHGPLVIAGGAGDAPDGGANVSVAGNGDGSGAGRTGDLSRREWLILVPLIAAILFLGIYPKPVLSRIDPSAARTVACVSPPPIGLIGPRTAAQMRQLVHAYQAGFCRGVPRSSPGVAP
jgi:hypothetical protein